MTQSIESTPSATRSPSQDPATMQAYAHVLKQLPTMIHPSWKLATHSLLLLVTLILSSLGLLLKLPWYLMPLGWLMAGMTLAWAFVIGQDCAHRTFTSSLEFNKVVGELCFLFMGQPYELFRITHVYPYVHTPVATWLETHPQDAEPKAGFGSIPNPPLPILQSIKMMLSERFQSVVPSMYQKKLEISMGISHVFLLIFIPTMILTTGFRGLLNYWLFPLLVCHMVYPLWTLFISGVIRLLPRDVAISVPSYHLAQLAYQLEHYIDGQYMDVEQVIRYYINRIDWLHAVILIPTPIIAYFGMQFVSLHYNTLIFTIFYVFYTGLGITAGYHRLWAHRSYEASLPVRIFLMLAGSGALEGSIKWWCGGHRVHHRYTDTPKDPYNAQGGFWYAHIGWMLVKPDPANKGHADIKDLQNDPLIQLQHTYYLIFGPFMAFIVPTLICGIGWNDWMGGFIYAGVLRQVIVHHATFCVNSVAHYFGEHTYDDIRSPRDSIITALLTFGEGYHNFHHEFPNDYRNGIRWYDYDPTKWLILIFHKSGLVHNLKTFSSNEIARGRTTMTEKKLELAQQQLIKEKLEIRYPPTPEELPEMTWNTFVDYCSNQSKQWIVIQGLVHDVSSFISDHPGGIPFIKSAIGQDGTSRFLGETGIYRHASAAHNLLSNLRIARIGEKDEYRGSPKLVAVKESMVLPTATTTEEPVTTTITDESVASSTTSTEEPVASTATTEEPVVSTCDNLVDEVTKKEQ